MAKSAGLADQLDFSVIQNVDWDPMQILHENEGKVNDDNFHVPQNLQRQQQTNDDNSEDDNPDDNQQQQQQGKQGKNIQNRQSPVRKGPDFTNIELTDEQFEQGLQNTTNRRTGGSNQQQQSQQPNQGGADKSNSAGAGTVNKNKPANQQQQSQDPQQATAFKAHYDLMVEAGEWEPLEGFDGTEESYIKAKDHNQQLFRDQGINEFLDEAFETNPEGKVLGKRLLNHLANGGKVSDFVTLMAPTELNFDALDDQDETVASAAATDILRQYYSSVGWDGTAIEKKLAQLNKTDGVVEEAKIVAPVFKKTITNKANTHAQQLATQKTQNQNASRTTNNALLGMINKGHKFGDLQIGKDKKEKLEYQTYMFEPTEQGGSEFGIALQNAYKDPEFLLYLAASLKNNLHKNPAALTDNKQQQQQATNSLERKLSGLLQNKSLSNDQTGRIPADSGASGGNNSKYEFSLDDAVPIHIR